MAKTSEKISAAQEAKRIETDYNTWRNKNLNSKVIKILFHLFINKKSFFIFQNSSNKFYQSKEERIRFRKKTIANINGSLY